MASKADRDQIKSRIATRNGWRVGFLAGGGIAHPKLDSKSMKQLRAMLATATPRRKSVEDTAYDIVKGSRSIAKAEDRLTAKGYTYQGTFGPEGTYLDKWVINFKTPSGTSGSVEFRVAR